MLLPDGGGGEGGREGKKLGKNVYMYLTAVHRARETFFSNLRGMLHRVTQSGTEFYSEIFVSSEVAFKACGLRRMKLERFVHFARSPSLPLATHPVTVLYLKGVPPLPPLRCAFPMPQRSLIFYVSCDFAAVELLIRS